MTRLAGEKFAVTMLAGEFAVAHGDLPAHGDSAGATFNFPAFNFDMFPGSCSVKGFTTSA